MKPSPNKWKRRVDLSIELAEAEYRLAKISAGERKLKHVATYLALQDSEPAAARLKRIKLMHGLMAELRAEVDQAMAERDRALDYYVRWRDRVQI